MISVMDEESQEGSPWITFLHIQLPYRSTATAGVTDRDSGTGVFQVSSKFSGPGFLRLKFRAKVKLEAKFQSALVNT
jgi:hypothetical protein